MRAANPGREPRPSLEAQGFNPAQSRARRTAERDLLSVLVAWPSGGRCRVLLDDGTSLPLPEAVTPESFLDPLSRAVMEAIHVWLEDGRAFGASELLAELEDPEAKTLATELLITGARRVASENEVDARLQEAVDAFERIRRVRGGVFTDSPRFGRHSDEPAALAARLEAIRNRGRDPTAFGRLPGSGRSGPAAGAGRATGPPGDG
jgi:hypothetical protein